MVRPWHIPFFRPNPHGEENIPSLYSTPLVAFGHSMPLLFFPARLHMLYSKRWPTAPTTPSVSHWLSPSVILMSVGVMAVTHSYTLCTWICMYSGQKCGRGQDATFYTECSLAAAVAWWKIWIHSISSERTRGWLIIILQQHDLCSLVRSWQHSLFVCCHQRLSHYKSPIITFKFQQHRTVSEVSNQFQKKMLLNMVSATSSEGFLVVVVVVVTRECESFMTPGKLSVQGACEAFDFIRLVFNTALLCISIIICPFHLSHPTQAAC